MGITRVAPKLTKIETRLNKDGVVESERIIHPDGHIEVPNQQAVVSHDIEIEILKKDIEIEKLKKELASLKQQ